MAPTLAWPYLTFRQAVLSIRRDRGHADNSLGSARRESKHKGGNVMRGISTFLAAAAAGGLVSGGAPAADPPKGEITVWSWNIAAEALDMVVPDFNKKYPDVKVHVVNMGHGDVV